MMTDERKEELQRIWEEDPEDTSWKEKLTEEEAALVAEWDREAAVAITNLVEQLVGQKKTDPKN